jgi:hypothetical protein
MSRSLTVRPSHAWRWRVAACAVVLILLNPPKARAEWVSVPQAGGAGVSAGYDTARVRASDGILEVWTREQGAALRPAMVEEYRRRGLSPVQVQDFGERFAQRLTRWRVDCNKRLARILAVGDSDADGRTTFTSEAAGEDGQIWPDTAVDAAAQALCGKATARTAAKSKAATRNAPRRDRESRPR